MSKKSKSKKFNVAAHSKLGKQANRMFNRMAKGLRKEVKSYLKSAPKAKKMYMEGALTDTPAELVLSLVFRSLMYNNIEAASDISRMPEEDVAHLEGYQNLRNECRRLGIEMKKKPKEGKIKLDLTGLKKNRL